MEVPAIPLMRTMAVVGILDDIRMHRRHYFAEPDDLILAIRSAAPTLAGSEYEALFGNDADSHWAIDLNRECRLVNGLVDAAERGLIRSAHDVAEGGIAVALAE